MLWKIFIIFLFSILLFLFFLIIIYYKRDSNFYFSSFKKGKFKKHTIIDSDGTIVFKKSCKDSETFFFISKFPTKLFILLIIFIVFVPILLILIDFLIRFYYKESLIDP